MPDLDNLDNFNANEAHQRQLHLFLQEVRQQQALPTIGSYMKLYTSLQTSKLAQLCEMDGEGLRDQLMCVMHKTRQLVHQKEGTPLDGVLQPCGEVEFYLDGDMVHINAQKPQRPHADVFLEHIVKFQEMQHLKQRRFNKNTATYYFPAAVAETKEVSVIGSDPDSEVLKLRVSTANKEIKAEDTQRQRQEIETETKDAAVGYLAKHGIEQKLSECLRTMLRMKPEEPIDFMCKFLTGGKFVPEESSSPVQQGKPEAPPAPTAPPAETAPPTPAAGPPEAAQPDARAALMKSVRAGDLIGAVEEEDKLNVPFALRPSVGTWLMPLSLDQVSHTTPEASQLHRRGSTEPEVAIGDWLLAPNGSFNLKGLGHTSMECCEVERLLTKALMEMDGELAGEYYAFAAHPMNPGVMTGNRTAVGPCVVCAALESQDLRQFFG
eukprot:g2503.t1